MFTLDIDGQNTTYAYASAATYRIFELKSSLTSRNSTNCIVLCGKQIDLDSVTFDMMNHTWKCAAQNTCLCAWRGLDWASCMLKC